MVIERKSLIEKQECHSLLAPLIKTECVLLKHMVHVLLGCKRKEEERLR